MSRKNKTTRQLATNGYTAPTAHVVVAITTVPQRRSSALAAMIFISKCFIIINFWEAASIAVTKPGSSFPQDGGLPFRAWFIDAPCYQIGGRPLVVVAQIKRRSIRTHELLELASVYGMLVFSLILANILGLVSVISEEPEDHAMNFLLHRYAPRVSTSYTDTHTHIHLTCHANWFAEERYSTAPLGQTRLVRTSLLRS
jgi:hypothetical protein